MKKIDEILQTTSARVTAIAGIVGLSFTVGSAAYKHLHLDDVHKLEVNTLVPRIVNAMNVRCEAIQAGNDPAMLELEIIEPLRQRYEELTGRAFSYGDCLEGKRVSSYAIPK